jgi:hypothetical protein
MTKRELIEELAPYPDDAWIDVRLEADDRAVEGVADVLTHAGKTWVTLGVVGVLAK